MKNLILNATFIALAFVFMSWGYTGHRTVGKIAENHLSAKAKMAIKYLLNDDGLVKVATWADEMRGSDPAYKKTAPWHYINLPLGLSYTEFSTKIESMGPDNIYGALHKCEHVLTDTLTSKAEKTEALKFIIHFVGDAHQPMHVARAEDKGGNAIHLNYLGQETNLHSIWDTKLLEHQGLTYEQLAEKYDHISDKQINKWQNDSLMQWLWESYQLSTRIYSETDTMKGKDIDDKYYQEYIGIIGERIAQSGIRLAGLLNQLFENFRPGEDTGTLVTNADTLTKDKPLLIDVHDVLKHTGETVKICTKAYGYKEIGEITLVDMGAAYPEQLLTVVLRDDTRKLADSINKSMICVSGKLILYKGKPEIIVSDAMQIENSCW